MNQVIIQGESSGGPSGLPLKRRRGRPRKNPSLKHPKGTRTPPGFEGVKEHVPQRAENTVGIDYMVGQAVTGVVEATFDAGYLLTVKIGNSTTNLRGVVFKPGHYVPITSENDVAPHVQMIRRNNVNLPAGNQGRSHGQKLAMQTVANNTLVKRKYTKSAPSVPPVGVRGQMRPVVLEPVSFINGMPNSNQMGSTAPQTGHVLDFGDKSVHMVEPISMLPPDRSLPVSQIFVTTQPQRVTEVSMQNENGSFNENTSEAGHGDKTKSMTPTESDSAGSSELSDSKTENGDEALKASEDLETVSKPETGNNVEPFPVDPMQTAPIATSPLFRFGTGRMTELLQAVQENMKDNNVPMAEQPTPASEVGFHQTGMTETGAGNEARAP